MPLTAERVNNPSLEDSIRVLFPSKVEILKDAVFLSESGFYMLFIVNAKDFIVFGKD